MFSQENSQLAALMARAAELIREIHNLSEISAEALQNNRLWHSKYAKLKDLFLKNIADELTLEDLMQGNGDFRDFEDFLAKTAKIAKNSQRNGSDLRELESRNRENREELRQAQEKLRFLKQECKKLEEESLENRETLELERNFQRKTADLEQEIARIKENLKETAENARKFEALSQDFSSLKEEKRKMEAFYAKTLKELEQELANKPKKVAVLKNESENPAEIVAFGPRTLGNRENFQGKGLQGLETINEIRTNEKIEEIVESQVSVSNKKLQEIAEEQGKGAGKLRKEQVFIAKTAKNGAVAKKPATKKGKK